MKMLRITDTAKPTKEEIELLRIASARDCKENNWNIVYEEVKSGTYNIYYTVVFEFASGKRGLMRQDYRLERETGQVEYEDGLTFLL